jgi:hypothetical protein
MTKIDFTPLEAVILVLVACVVTGVCVYISGMAG